MVRQRFAFRIGWMASLAAIVMVSTTMAQEGAIPTIRQDVQTGQPSEPTRLPSTGSSESSTPRRSDDSGTSWHSDSSDVAPMAFLASVVITSPFWAPRALLGDEGLGLRWSLSVFSL